MGICITKSTKNLLESECTAKDLEGEIIVTQKKSILKHKHEIVDSAPNSHVDTKDSRHKEKVLEDKAGDNSGNLLSVKNADKSKQSDSESEFVEPATPSRKKKLGKVGRKFETESHPENFITEIKRPNDSDLAFLKEVIQHCSSFKDLKEEDIIKILSNMFSCSTKEGEAVFKQGDEASCMFVLAEGSCDVLINNESKRTLNPGDLFGELALLYNAPRSASIICIKPCKFWALDRKSFRRAIELISFQNYEINRQYIDKVSFFENFSESQKDNLASYVITQRYNSKESVFRQGDDSNSYYIIREGAIELWEGNLVMKTFVEGEGFGENALYKDPGLRTMTAVAKGDTTLLVLSRETLIDVLGAEIESVILKNFSIRVLEQHPILKFLSKIQKTKWSNALERVSFSSEQKLASQNEILEFIYIVIEGSVTCGGDTYVKGQIMGIEALSSNGHWVTPHDIMASESVLAKIKIADAVAIIGENLDTTVKKNIETYSEMVNVLAEDFRDSAKDTDLTNLVFINKLGEGQFGEVLLVANSVTHSLYALKRVSKIKVQEYDIGTHIINEKNLLMNLNFPFLVKLYKTLKDNEALYFLLNFIQGSELFEFIREIDLMNNSEAQFYIGTVILVIEYIHEKSIVYRDLKPENMIVDKEGYVNIIDFGTAKLLSSPKMRTNTIIGTPHYMAPEIIRGKGYSLAVDVWSIGIVLFELMCGGVPFGENASSTVEIYKEILNCKIKFPNFFQKEENNNVMDLITMLLNKIPEARIKNDFANLKSHPWFDGFPWDDLFHRKVKAPYLPKIQKGSSEAEIKRAIERGISIKDQIRVV